MKKYYFVILVVISIFIFECNNDLVKGSILYKITYRLETDHTGGPLFQLSVKNLNIKNKLFILTDSNLIRIKFVDPPQNSLSNAVYFEPMIDKDITILEFKDLGLVGLDSIQIREKFMNGITKNRINIYLNDSLLKSISIKKEPIFEYLVGTEKELSNRH